MRCAAGSPNRPWSNRVVEVTAGRAARCAPAVAQDGQLAHLDAHVPFVWAALFYDGTWQPRPGVAVGLLFLRRAGVADLDRALIRDLPSLSSSSYLPAPSRSQAENVCHYRLHRGLSSHTHQVCGALLVVDKETVTCALNLRSPAQPPPRPHRRRGRRTPAAHLVMGQRHPPLRPPRTVTPRKHLNSII